MNRIGLRHQRNLLAIFILIITVIIFCVGFFGDKLKAIVILMAGICRGEHILNFARKHIVLSKAERLISFYYLQCCFRVGNKLSSAAAGAKDIAPAVIQAGRSYFDMEIRVVVHKGFFALKVCILAVFILEILYGEFLAAIGTVADGQTDLFAAGLLDLDDLVSFVLALYKPAVFFESRDSYIGNLTAFSADNCLNAGNLVFGVLLNFDGLLVRMCARASLIRRKNSGSRQQGRDHENRHQHADKSLFHVSSCNISLCWIFMPHFPVAAIGS